MTEDEFGAYAALSQDTPHDVGADQRWAFGTGFSDPLPGLDAALPAAVDAAELSRYCLMLGDDALIHSHRLQEWITRAPELEEETAIANIALDLLGQARMLLQRAAQADGRGYDEDHYAFFREPAEFGNVRFVEEPDRDFAELVIRMLVVAGWRLEVLRRLSGSRDAVLAAVAAKAATEVRYHRDYAARWAVRLGDGTDESRRRSQAALDRIWPRAGELFAAVPTETALAVAGVAVDPGEAQAGVEDVVRTVCEASGLRMPQSSTPGAWTGPRGRSGDHSGDLSDILAELQSVARADPGATW